MDEYNIVKRILSSDDDIAVTSETEGIIYFLLYEEEYGLMYFKEESKTQVPVIFAVNNGVYDYPHIMTDEIKIDGNEWRVICLYEAGSNINYVQPYAEKICEAINRLKELLSLTPIEVEREFQKEFLYYWKEAAESSIEAFIGTERIYKKLNLYQGKNEDYRAVSKDINLNDKEKYKHVPNVEVYYIPITDNRRIVPPVKNKPWTSKDIMRIIRGTEISRISSETYQKIKDVKSKTLKAILIFEMIVNKQQFAFGVQITFKLCSEATLLERLQNSIIKIEPLIINRYDYYYLNKQIGNDISIIDKRVAIIGCGSLGSYVATELVKAGIRNLTVYDDDYVEATNILRYSAELGWCNIPKVHTMKYKLERIHPEVHVESKKIKISDVILKEDMNKYDLIIFTVGSSDVQLSSNRVFMENGYGKPVVYAWLEAGGTDSHILAVDYSKIGCFECLFTDHKGELVNNKANKLSEVQVEENTIRNGCGATRVAYGTGILLRTTCVLLDIVKRVFSEMITENMLLDITPSAVDNNGNKFIEVECHCCGNRDNGQMRKDETS